MADDPGVGLRAEAEPDGLVLVLDDDSGGSGGQADGVAQRLGGDAGGRGLVVLAGGVQADDGVEVDDAACLVLSDLDEPDADQGAQVFLGDAQAAGELAGQVGGEPAPQVGRAGVEQHRGLVVVAVAAHGLAEPGVGLEVAGRAGDVAAVRAAAGLGVAAGTAGQDGLAAHPPGVDRAERRRGEGGEHARVRGDRVGDALAASRRGRAGGRRACRSEQAGQTARGGCRTRRSLAVEGGEFAGGSVDHVGAGAELDRVRAGAGGELVFPGAEVARAVVSSAVAPVPSRMGSGPRAAVAAVSAVTATTCLDRGNPGR